MVVAENVRVNWHSMRKWKATETFSHLPCKNFIIAASKSRTNPTSTTMERLAANLYHRTGTYLDTDSMTASQASKMEPKFFHALRQAKQKVRDARIDPNHYLYWRFVAGCLEYEEDIYDYTAARPYWVSKCLFQVAYYCRTDKFYGFRNQLCTGGEERVPTVRWPWMPRRCRLYSVPEDITIGSALRDRRCRFVRATVNVTRPYIPSNGH